MLVNGAPGNMISIRDRGLLYGDGVFRTLIVRDGKPQHWLLHYQKLVHDCAALGIACPDFEVLSAELAGLTVEHPDAVFKLIVTRGQSNGHGDEARLVRFPHPNPDGTTSHSTKLPEDSSQVAGYLPEGEGTNERSSEFKIKRGYAPDPQALPTHIWDVAPLPVYLDEWQGVTLHLCGLRLGHQPRLAGIKHLNRLENVLATTEIGDAAEGLLLDVDNRVIEGVRSNVFLVSGGRLITPDLSHCGVAGVQRDRVIACAGQQGITVEVRDIGLDELRASDELFLTNSVFGLWSVAQFQARRWTDFSVAGRIRSVLAG